MVTRAESLLPRHDASFSFTALPSAYQEALRAFWSGSIVKAIERVTAELANCESLEHTAMYYRCWIECLAAANDQSSLALLGEHLYARSREAEANEKVTYAALRALVHYEMDEFETASLLARTLSGEPHNPYALEVRHLVAERTSGDNGGILLRGQFSDYFHWDRLVVYAQRAGNETFRNDLLRVISQVFPDSTLPNWVTMHDAFERNDFESAADAARRLAAAYPDHPDFHFYAGLAQMKSGSPGFAIANFQRAIGLKNEDDIEFILALGDCHFRMAQLNEAKSQFVRARNLAEEQGLPIHPIDSRIASVNQHLRHDDGGEVLRATRMWFVPVSSRTYFDLTDKPESEVSRLYRPMGTEPRPGDFCFIAANSADGRSRICAIYSVDSDPIPDTFHKNLHALQLIARPSRPIPIDMQVLDEDAPKRKDLDPSHPYYHGVFELADGAIDVVLETFRRYNDERDHNWLEDFTRWKRPG